MPNPDDTKEFGAWEDVWAQYESYPTDAKEYIRLNVVNPESLPSNAYDKAVEHAKEKGFLFCFINAKRRTTASGGGQQQMTVEEFQATDPWKVVKMYATDTQNPSFEEEDLYPLFEEVLDNLKLKEE